MKFVMSLPLSPDGMKMLEENHIEYYIGNNLDWTSYPEEELASADVLIVRMEKCPAEVLAKCPKLKVIGRPGMGFDNIAVDYATERGIPVVLTPGANARSVAEHSVMLMLALGKHLKTMETEGRKGNWGIRAQGLQMEMMDKKVGIVGVGGIGAIVAQLCGAFGMKCLGFSHSHNRAKVEAAGCEYYENLDDLLRDSDFVSLHMPLNKATYHCIGARELGLMKKTAFLINTARGAVVDEQALADAVNQGVIAGAGVDVYSEEPARLDNPVFSAPNILCTPHTAALTPEGWNRMACYAVEGCLAVLNGKRPKMVANPEVYEK